MRDSAPIWQGIIAVAALFGIIATGVSWVLYDYSLVANLFIGGLVAFVAAVALAIGWRAPNEHPIGAGNMGAAAPAPAPTPAPKPTASPAPAAAAAAPSSPAPAAEAAPSTGEASRPAALEGPRDGKADNLKEIKGIGPKLEKLCNTLGFYHFDQIANWSADEVAWVDENLEGFKGRVTRDDWVAQAKILAAGGETEFSKKVEGGKVY